MVGKCLEDELSGRGYRVDDGWLELLSPLLIDNERPRPLKCCSGEEARVDEGDDGPFLVTEFALSAMDEPPPLVFLTAKKAGEGAVQTAELG